MGTVTASVAVTPDTYIEPWSQPWRDGHIAGVMWDGLTLHMRSSAIDGSDEGIVGACDRLIAAIQTVRATARYRIELAEREAELEGRDDRIDAGLPTGYIGDPA